MRAVLTVVGKDKKGIIYRVSEGLNNMDINIEDISQTILQDYFTMIMIVDIKNANCDFKTIQENLQKVGETNGIEVRIQHEDIFNAMHKLG